MELLFAPDLHLNFDVTQSSGTPIIITGSSIDNPSILSDTVGWVEISGDYIASGCEKFLVIGNFKHQQETDFLYSDTLIESYYYIDNVSLSLISNEEVSIPNVFSPNNDGINDFFFFENGCSSINILNRWGEIVYFSNLGISWDGTSRGNPTSEGVYFYRCTVVNCNGITEEKTGFIQLIR